MYCGRRSPFASRRFSRVMVSAETILFTTRTFVEFDDFGFADNSFERDKTIDFGFADAAAGLFPANGFFFIFGFALFFVFNCVMSFLLSLRHLIGNILLKTLAHAFERDTLKDRVEESLDNNFFGFRLRDAARF